MRFERPLVRKRCVNAVCLFCLARSARKAGLVLLLVLPSLVLLRIALDDCEVAPGDGRPCSSGGGHGGVAHGGPQGCPGYAEGVRARRRLAGPAAHDLPEHLAETRRHEVVEDGVDGRAEVKEHAGDEVHVLEGLQVVLAPVADEAPHQAVRVERRPADAEHHYQDDWEGEKGWREGGGGREKERKGKRVSEIEA